MYDAQTKVLRYGVIVGLVTATIGLIANPLDVLETVGLAIIILTPLFSLSFISIRLLKEKRMQEFVLALFTITVIIISIIISLLRNH